MIGEIDLYGVLLPAPLVWALAAVLLGALQRRACEALGLYRWVWHRPLFDLAFVVILLSGITFLAGHWTAP